jgi:hypothetical protein
MAISLSGCTFGLQGCEITDLALGLVDSCVGSDTISESDFDDLNVFEQLGYEENNCGRYAPRDDLLGDFTNLFD